MVWYGMAMTCVVHDVLSFLFLLRVLLLTIVAADSFVVVLVAFVVMVVLVLTVYSVYDTSMFALLLSSWTMFFVDAFSIPLLAGHGRL